MFYSPSIKPRHVPDLIKEMVKEVFCDPDRARYGPYDLLDEGEEVLEGTLFEFPVADLNDDKAYYLQLFTGVKGVGAMIWDQEIRTLMRISRLGHPALPEVITGGYEESPKGLDDFAFVITPMPEARLSDWGEMERLRGNRREALWQFGMLADALTKLHWHGIMHRNIWPGTIERYTLTGGLRTSALRLIRFEMSAFIENIFRRVSAPNEQAADYAKHEAVRRFIIGEGLNALACCAPERLHMLAPAPDDDPEDMIETDRSDVYSLGVVVCQWFADKEKLGEEILTKAFGGGNIDHEAAESFRKSLIKSLRLTKGLPRGLRKLIESMLHPKWLDRPTSQEICDEISRNYESWSLEWSELVRTPPRLVSYLPEETGKYIFAWNWISYDPLDPIGMRLATKLIEDDLRDASLVYSPEGFSPFSEGEVKQQMHGARHVLLGTRAAWFCELFHSNNNHRGELWKNVVLIKYVARRDGAQGSKVNDLYKTLFRQRVGSIEIMPFTPATRPVLDKRRRGRPEWTELLADVEARNPKQEGRLKFESALDFLLKFFRIELEARIYPFTKVSDDGHVAILKFSEEMDDERRQKAESALFSFFMNRSDEPRPYFGNFFRSDETYEDAADWSVEYYADRGGFPERKPLGKAIVIDSGDTFEVKLKVPASPHAPQIPQKGWLAPAKDASRRTELRRQAEAVQELSLIGSLLGQIQDPQTIRTLRGPWKDAGQNLSDNDSSIDGKHGQYFVQELLCCQPFYALHGPPGTGKTTVVSEAVAALLEREPAARILISAQSNFALDNLGERLGSLLKEPGRIVRVTSEASEEKVSEPMKKCMLGPLTSKVIRDIAASCGRAAEELNDNGHHEFAKLAREWLENLKGSTPDLQDRVRAGANVVLATCSGATKFQIDRASGTSLFDWVIIEEAARAWPTELAIPLIRGFRWALIGDHKQLPAHRIRDIERFLIKCEESGNMGEIKRHGLDRERYMKIYKFFGELFKKIEEQDNGSGRESSRYYEPPLGQMRKQFRMRKPIADVVSEAFYTAPPLLTSEKTEKRPPFTKPWFLSNGESLVWIDTSDAISYDDERCWKNKGEARLVRDLLLLMEPLPSSDQEPFSKNPLAIISPYREQNELIKQYLGELNHDQVNAKIAKRLAVQRLARPDIIHSVHSIQGREADVVVTSLVRSGSAPGTGVHAKLGHVADPALVNVLFSRPRLLLVVIGNLSFFETCGATYPEAAFWGNICKTVRRNAKVISAEDLYARQKD